MTPSLKERFVGGLLGCAVGDALGAPYEGLWSHSIPDEQTLLAGFGEYEGYPLGQFTDDTQLTVATVRSILAVGEVSPAHIARSIATLFKRGEVIGPGGACMSAAHSFLKTKDWQTCGAELGQAGNGTAMRTSMLGLAFLSRDSDLPEVVADVSRITHRDPRSIAGGVAVAKAAQLLSSEREAEPTSFCRQIAGTISGYSEEFAAFVEGLPTLMERPADVALSRIAWAGMPTPEFDKPIITPFVIPTVLASLWCVLTHPTSWSGAVTTAIRLGGDVDTLGAIVGSLMGIRLGVEAIPEHLRQSVQHTGKLETLALRYHECVTRMS